MSVSLTLNNIIEVVKNKIIIFSNALCSYEISAVASINKMEVINECGKKMYKNNFLNTASKSDWFYSVTIIISADALKMGFLTFHANCLLLRRQFHEIQNLFSGVYKKNIFKKNVVCRNFYQACRALTRLFPSVLQGMFALLHYNPLLKRVYSVRIEFAS